MVDDFADDIVWQLVPSQREPFWGFRSDEVHRMGCKQADAGKDEADHAETDG